MEKFDTVVEAGQLAEMSNTRQSVRVADYYVDPVKMSPDNLPVMSYGMQLDRLADAPPSALIDTESSLKNQYDILSKSGHVYRKGGEPPVARPKAAAPAPPPSAVAPVSAKAFFNPISGRDLNKFSKKSCEDMNFWRDDVTMVHAPVTTRFEHVDTRALTKDKIDSAEC